MAASDTTRLTRTNCEHCQRRMHQNESRTAGINSCNFCCSNGIGSNGEVGAPIALKCTNS